MVAVSHKSEQPSLEVPQTGPLDRQVAASAGVGEMIEATRGRAAPATPNPRRITRRETAVGRFAGSGSSNRFSAAVGPEQPREVILMIECAHENTFDLVFDSAISCMLMSRSIDVTGNCSR